MGRRPSESLPPLLQAHLVHLPLLLPQELPNGYDAHRQLELAELGAAALSLAHAVDGVARVPRRRVLPPRHLDLHQV